MMKIKKLITLLALLAGATILILIVLPLSAKDVIIAENGQAKAEIVIPAEPSAYVKFAAEELKQYLDKITGGDFKITNQPTAAVKIRLGQSAEAEAAGLKPETLKRDGFFISAKGNDIFIVGVDNPAVKKVKLFHLFYDEPRRATLLGVYEFLEQLGVRWPAPGPANEYVPTRADLKIPEGTQKIEPFFADRQCLSAWNFMAEFPDAKEYCNSDDAFLWGLRLKLSGRYMVTGCHSEKALKLKEVWGDHPEHFALIKGKRNPRYSCWTDPAVAEMWEKAADVYFSGGTPAEAGLPHLKPYYGDFSWPCPFISEDDFMIDPMDHGSSCDGRCRCQRCNEFREKYPCADDSEIIWKVIVEVAESIKKKHPGKFISTLVYPPKMQLPKYVKIPDNVRVRICIGGPKEVPTPNRSKAELDLVKIWSKALGGNKPPLWTYQCEIHGRKLPGPPETYPHLTAEFLKTFRNDIAGMGIEQHGLTHAYINLDRYIVARLLWDPDRKVDEELADYFKSYYGPAAEPAQKLFQRFEDNWIKYWKLATPDVPKSKAIGLGSPAKELQKLVWTKVYNQDEMQIIDTMITGIEKAAEGNPVYSKRAALLRPWIFNIMKSERAEVMDKEETRRKIIAQVPVVKAEPTAADWTSAPVYQLVSAARLKPQLAAGGQFQLLRFGDTLYLRAELKEPKLTESLTKKDRKPGDSEVWKDNDLEIFIYSTSSRDLWQIIVNDQGNWASQKINTGVSQWIQLEKFKVQVSSTAGGWMAEAAIPLEQLGAGELRFNLTRNRQVKGQPEELSTWSPLAKVGNWHDPENYGTLVFGGYTD